MDPVSLILSFALQHQQATATIAENYGKAGQVDASRLHSSVADFAIQTLSCYHRTAKFRDVEILGAPWPNQYKFGAKGSLVMRISFVGLSQLPYQMTVAAMVKDQSYRTFVLSETSLVPYNRKCSLEYWTETTT